MGTNFGGGELGNYPDDAGVKAENLAWPTPSVNFKTSFRTRLTDFKV